MLFESGVGRLFITDIINLCAIKVERKKVFQRNFWKKLAFFTPPPLRTNFAFYIFNGFGSATKIKGRAKGVYSLVKQQQCMRLFIAQDAETDRLLSFKTITACIPYQV